jgi:hypothetical protein
MSRRKGSKNVKPAKYPDRKTDRHINRASISSDKDRVFRCIDGEAIKENGQDIYFLISADDGSELCDPEGLNGWDIIDWIVNLGVNECWGFGLGYDINWWLRLLKPDEPEALRPFLERLAYSNRNSVKMKHRRDGTNWHYRFTHYPGKLFRISRWRMVESYKIVGNEIDLIEEEADKKTVWIWDAYTFAAESFVGWCEAMKLCETEDELEWLRTMKGKRAQFDKDHIDTIRQYNQLEMKLLARGVTRLKSMAIDSGYAPQRGWYSPASLAARAFQVNGIADHLAQQETPWKVGVLARAAYFGGRAEIARIGQIDGPIYIYDIRSAYPAQMVQLPSLKDGQWQRRKGYPEGYQGIALLRVRWWTNDRLPFGPFPVNPGVGSLRYPRTGEGWYWWSEVEAAHEIPGISIQVLDGFYFTPASSITPFDYLRDIYQQRVVYKAAGDERQYALKLVINSSYGKLAQRPTLDPDTLEWNMPRWYQPIYAGLITSGTRAELLKAYRQHPNKILYFATDSIASTVPLDLPLSKKLGDWEAKEVEWIFIAQSGVYFYPEPEKQGQIVNHTRGFGRTRVGYQDVLDAWQEGAVLEIKENRFLGYRVALRSARGLDAWCKWTGEEDQDHARTVKLTSEPRRVDGPRQNGYMLTYPPDHAEPYLDDLIRQDLWQYQWSGADENRVEEWIDDDQPKDIED